VGKADLKKVGNRTFGGKLLTEDRHADRCEFVRVALARYGANSSRSQREHQQASQGSTQNGRDGEIGECNLNRSN